MHEVSKTTDASGFTYPITFQQFDSLAEAVEAVGGEGNLVGIINAAQEQGAKQGGKTEVRDTIKKFGAESAETAEAVAEHQRRAAKYVIGAPRGSTGGITKTKAREAGAKLLEQLGEEGLKALMLEQGLNPEELGK